MRTKIVLAVILASYSASAEVIRAQCQTEESRGLRLASRAMYKAAEESEPFRHCNGNGCSSMPSVLVDSQRATAERFKAEARASLLKARAAEAAKCPQWEDAIMELGPATQEERDAVATEFEKQMEAERKSLADMKAWQVAHPQCKHVEWRRSGGLCSWPGGTCGEPIDSPEDFSGRFKGKAGQCSASGNGVAWRGTDDSLKMYDPETNPLIAKVRCANALAKINLGDGSYADPKLCQRQAP